jgi:hypothetical protein
MNTLKFDSHYSAPDASFWNALSDYKLNVAKLGEEEKSIWGYYFPGEGMELKDDESGKKTISKTDVGSSRPLKKAYLYVDEQAFSNMSLP